MLVTQDGDTKEDILDGESSLPGVLEKWEIVKFVASSEYLPILRPSLNYPPKVLYMCNYIHMAWKDAFSSS